MELQFYRSVKESLTCQDHKIIKSVDNILKIFDQKNSEFQVQLNDLQDINTAKSRIKEVKEEQHIYRTRIVELEKHLKERKVEIIRMDGLKQQYLLRRAKAKSRLNAKDVEFIDSIEKRLRAFKWLTGVIWDYSSCKNGYVRGYIKNTVSNKVKSFQGHLDPDQIWQIIEKTSKKEK